MFILIAVILPVFLVIGFGYVARWRGLMSDDDTDALMRFTQGIAIPLLLFRAISGLDLGASFNLPLLSSFYTGALVSFGAAMMGARLLGRPIEDSVAIGFAALFSNSLLLGIPITERAFGTDALTGNYAIIALHSPICYGVGITAMELARARGSALHLVPAKIVRAMSKNPLILGIVAGLVLNLSGLSLPRPLAEATDLLTRAALPAALFGLGGVLYRYKPEGDLRIIALICGCSLLLHPAIATSLAHAQSLPSESIRSITLTAAMAPGINSYIFANLYGVAKRVAASAVLFGTAFSILSSAVWLSLLP